MSGEYTEIVLYPQGSVEVRQRDPHAECGSDEFVPLLALEDAEINLSFDTGDGTERWPIRLEIRKSSMTVEETGKQLSITVSFHLSVDQLKALQEFFGFVLHNRACFITSDRDIP